MSKKIKRYLCFSYYIYEASGGINDLIAECDTLYEAKSVFDSMKGDERGSYEFQIYDLVDKVLHTRPDDSNTWDWYNIELKDETHE